VKRELSAFCTYVDRHMVGMALVRDFKDWVMT